MARLGPPHPTLSPESATAETKIEFRGEGVLRGIHLKGPSLSLITRTPLQLHRVATVYERDTFERGGNVTLVEASRVASHSQRESTRELDLRTR